jgi:hypothetical protein
LLEAEGYKPTFSICAGYSPVLNAA